MPAKNSIKKFVENGYYHLYNRGVEKRDIFSDKQDYAVFLSLLKKYLSCLGSDPHPLAYELNLLAFCLMPNHFHLLVKQHTRDGITKLIRAVCTNYVTYFNNKYERVGTLFQGKYKAILVETDAYLLHLSRYIHLNPYPGSDPRMYNYSSYSYYLGTKNSDWLKSTEILDYFKRPNATSNQDYFTYESFVEDYKLDSNSFLGELTLEDV